MKRAYICVYVSVYADASGGGRRSHRFCDGANDGHTTEPNEQLHRSYWRCIVYYVYCIVYIYIFE